MLIGEVGLKTRSMLGKREGLPRSWTRAAVERPTAVSEETFSALAVVARPVS